LLQRGPEPKSGKNRLHLDLHHDDGPAEVERLVALGASRVGAVNTEYLELDGTRFQVMADPEGNEFCVVWRLRPAPRDEPSIPRSDRA
jgi:predicted enzyme related to lactoylglutathione lyase